MPPEVAAVFASYPAGAVSVLRRLRELIFRIARDAEAGPVEETLRWGEPAYIAPKGSTVRLGVTKAGAPALFVICTTSLIEDFRIIVGDKFAFEGTRAVVFAPGAPVDEEALALLIRAALTYKSRSRL